MQPSRDQFSELRQLLQTGQYENNGQQPAIPRSTQAQPAQQSDTLVFSAQQHPVGRPPVARTGTATRSRRPPPAPGAAPFVSQGSTRVPSARPANRNDVDMYLAQLNQHQSTHRNTQQAPATLAPAPPPAAAAAAAAAAQQAAPEQHRRAKRGKPMARRSLQALFDRAAEDSSTWQNSGASTGGDTEDDGDTGGLFASATSGDSSLHLHNNTNNPLVSSMSDAEAAAAAILAGLPGPSTPANCDSGLLGAAAAGGPLIASHPGSPLDTTTTAKNMNQDTLSSIVPLRHLLMSERGRRLTALEVKAIILRVAEDLAALHAANAVHRRVSIESISLTTSLATGNTRNTTATDIEGEQEGIAVAILPPGRSAAVLGSNRCYWALKDPVFDAEHAPPEVACCPVDRPVAFTPAGDMWGLGVVLFSLLSAGRVPFTTPSFLCGHKQGEDSGNSSGSVATSTVDALQRHLHGHINCQIDVINQLSAAQAAGASGSNDDDLLEMTAIGFDAQAKKLLLGLLHADPAQRFCALDVLNHPWVAEAVPFVPKASPSNHLPFGSMTASAGGNRETSPPISDVLRRTEQLGFTPQTNNPHLAAAVTGAGLAAPGVDAATECPYPIIGHVAQPLEVIVAGKKVTISALHAVYDVPGYGAMMSAAPLAVADPAEVSAAAANGVGTSLSQYLNLGGPSS